MLNENDELLTFLKNINLKRIRIKQILFYAVILSLSFQSQTVLKFEINFYIKQAYT